MVIDIKQRDPMHILAEIQANILTIGPNSKLKDILAAIAEGANTILGGDFCVVQPYHQASDKFYLDQFTAAGSQRAINFLWTDPRPNGHTRTVLHKGILPLENYDDKTLILDYPFLKSLQGALRDVTLVKASLGLRLEAGGEIVGALLIGYPEPHHFSEEEIRIARLFASQAAIAIRNIHLYTNLQTLTDITQSIATLHPGVSLKENLLSIVTAANRVLGANLSVIFPYDEERDEFLMNELVASGEGIEGYQWQTPRDKGGTRLILGQPEIIAINLNEASPYGKLLGSGAFREHFSIQAMAGIPLRVGDERLGVLYVNFKTVHTFDEIEKGLLKAFASQAAIILHNARLFDESQIFSESRSKLLTVTQNVTGSIPDLKQVLAGIAEAANSVLGGILSVVMPYEQSTDRFLPEQITGGGDRRAKEFPWSEPRPEGSTRTALKEGLIKIEDYQKSSYPFLKIEEGKVTRGALLDVAPVKASLGVRMEASNEWVGVLWVGYPGPHKFTKDEIELAQLFASLAAIAIRNARFYASLRKSIDIAGQLTSEFTDPEKLLQSMLEQAVELFKVTRGGIVYHEITGGRVVASIDRRSPTPEIVGVTFGDTPLQRAVRNAEKPMFEINDIDHEPLLGEDERKALLDLGVKSTVIVPLIARGKVIGSLGLDNCDRVRVLSDWEKELLRILAGMAAVAIDNARIYQVAEEGLREIIAVSSELMQKALQPELSREQFLDYTMERTLKLMNFKAGWLVLREGEWVSIVATDLKHHADIGRRFRMDDCISGLSMMNMKFINIPDMENMSEEYRRVYKAPSGPTMKSELVVPLVLGGEAIGAFNIESDKLGGFEPRHEAMLKLLNDQVALALETKSLREETYAVNRVSLELAQEAEIGSIVRSILENALDLVFGKQKEGQERKGYGQVLLSEGNDLVIRYTTNKPRVELPPDDLNRHYGIHDCNSGLTFFERKPIVFPDVGKPDYYAVEFINTPVGREGRLIPRHTGTVLYRRALEVDKEAMIAEFAVPIVRGENVIGVLNVETSRTTGFTPAQQASLVAFIKKNANQLFEALRAPHRDELNALLTQALARAETQFGQMLRVESAGLIIEATTGGEMPGTYVTKSVCQRVVTSREALYVPNVAQDPDYQRYLGEEMKSQLAVPLILEDDLLGVLNLESPLLDFFRLSHVRVLEAFASQAVMAIDRARKAESTTMAEIGMLAGDIVHQLNNPLGAISMRLELLKEKPFTGELLALYPDIARFIERTERDLNSAKAIIKELRPVLKVRQNRPIALKISIDDGLARIDMPTNIQVTIKPFDATLQVNANERLTSVFWNLFDNARKAMSQGGAITVEVALSGDNQWVFIKVKDSGKGISDWRLPYIFDADESTTQDSFAPGHGLGLWWTRAQVTNFGGEIEAQSTVGSGTTFTIKLPKAT